MIASKAANNDSAPAYQSASEIPPLKPETRHAPAMAEFTERSAYPSPDDFEVMRPEYTDLEDGTFEAVIEIAPFRVTGVSSTRPGARRAALYAAEKTYRSYHPNYPVRSPYPDSFIDQEGVSWQRVPAHQRDTLGDYRFVDQDGEEDFADIENMLMWDVRPSKND